MRSLLLGAGAICASVCPALAPVEAGPTEPVNVFTSATSTSNQMDITVFTVPAGKHLAIEYVSISTTVPAGETVTRALMNVPVVHFFVVVPQGIDISGKKVFTAAQSLQVVIEGGQTIRFRVERDNFGTTGEVSVTLAGELTN